MGVDRRFRSRATEVAGRVFPASDAGPFHDAHPDAERFHELGTAQRDRRSQPRLRHRVLRHYNSPADPASRVRDERPRAHLGSASRGRLGVVADGHGQHSERHRVPGAGLTDDELFDASPVVHQFNEAFSATRRSQTAAEINVAIRLHGKTARTARRRTVAGRRQSRYRRR